MNEPTQNPGGEATPPPISASPYEAPGIQSSEGAVDPEMPKSMVPKVLGIIHIVYAILGIVAQLFGIVSMVFVGEMMEQIQETMGPQENQISSVLDYGDTLMTYTIINALVVCLICGLLIFAGVKLMKYKQIGAKLSQVWAYIRIAWAIIYTVISFDVMMEYQARVNGMNSEMPSSMVNAISIGSMAIGVIVLLVYPVVVLIYMNSNKVRQSLSK